MTNKTDSDPDFCFPSSSSSVPIPFHHQKMRKKRTKLIKIDPSPSLVTSAAAVATCSNIVSKPKYYAKKPDPSAPKITRPCSECGKKFWSWKALFGHMRCHPERQWRGINPPPNYRRPPIASIHELGNVEEAVEMITAEDHEVAACLLLLANSDPISSAILETECGSGGVGSGGVGGVAMCSSFHVLEDGTNCRFECSSCKKVFGSHQALGGHRASHKNVKGCFAITRSSGDRCDVGEDDSGVVGDVKENVEENGTNNNNNKTLMILGHKCSICLRVFSSGQALGGHKRCHWEKGEEASSSINHQLGLSNNVSAATRDSCGLDLNLPASVEDESSSSYSSGLTLDLRLGL